MQPSVSFISWPKCQNKSFPYTSYLSVKCFVAQRFMTGRHVRFLLQSEETDCKTAYKKR